MSNNGEGAIGIIGGSGLYEMEGFQAKKKHSVATPFGKPSDFILEGSLHGKKIFFLPRHARGHKILPSDINFRANIYALKKLGVRSIFSVSAVGSLQEKFRPGEFVLVDQFIDRTKGIRESTFFGDGIVGHVSMAEPICGHLRSAILASKNDSNVKLHEKGTYVCMEGPNFSTRAESSANHAAGFAIIGMTNVPEAYLAREANLCYASIGMVTDYDSWNEHEDAVSVEAVIAVMKENVARAKQLLSKTIASYKENTECSCRNANRFAVMTNPKMFPARTKSMLKLILT